MLSNPNFESSQLMPFRKNIKVIKSDSFDYGFSAVMPWARWALAHSEFGSSVNPITTRGVDYAHHITASPPGFENPAAALEYE